MFTSIFHDRLAYEGPVDRLVKFPELAWVTVTDLPIMANWF
jgi:hypothetical protein